MAIWIMTDVGGFTVTPVLDTTNSRPNVIRVEAIGMLIDLSMPAARELRELLDREITFVEYVRSLPEKDSRE